MLNKSLEQIIREVFTFLNYKNVFYLEDSSIFGNKHEENLYTVETFFFNDTVHSFCSYLSSYVFDIKALINNIELAPMVKINSIFLSASSSSLNRLAFWVSGCLLFAIILFVLCFIFLGRPKKMEPEKLAPYECGFAPFEDTYLRFDIRFYLVAILFIIFDLEVVYLFPWSLIFKSYIKTNVIGLDSNFIDSMVNSNFFINLDTFIFGNLFYSENLIVMDSIFLSLDNLINLVPFISMYVFLVILTVGFVYEWKRGALDWK